MKKFKIITLLLLFSGGVFAQQLPHYSQYLINRYNTNPAVGGSTDHFAASLNNRLQWVGITDAPRTYVFSLHGPINEKMGAGGIIYNDIVGPTRRTGAKFSYSYHLRLTQDLKLSFGVSAGILQYATDFSKITFNTAGDPATTNVFAAVNIPDFGAGLYLYSEKLFVSISSPQFFPSKVKYFENYEETKGKLVNHIYVSAGYKIPIGESIKIQPAFLMKYVSPVNPQFEGTLRVIFKDAAWLGASYRTEDAIALMAGYLLQENIMLSYSYDLISSKIKNYSSGTHELTIGIRFRKRVTKETVVVE